jgi:hypothetical protein
MLWGIRGLDDGSSETFLPWAAGGDKKLRGFSPLANYTDRAIAAGQRS